MNLTGFALRNQPLVLMIVAALTLYSFSVLGDFPSQEDPPITVREAVVVTFVPGMEAEDIELLVTRTIEKALARIPERDYIYSWSRTGVSEVRIKVLFRISSICCPASRGSNSMASSRRRSGSNSRPRSWPSWASPPLRFATYWSRKT
jgi:hypothetical protein